MGKCMDEVMRLIDEVYVRAELLESRLASVLSREETKGVLGIIAIINELYDKLAELRHRVGKCTE